MGRFLGTSPTSSTERGRRYEVIPRNTDEDERGHNTYIQAQLITASTPVLSPSRAPSRSALMRSDSEMDAQEIEPAHCPNEEEEETKKKVMETKEERELSLSSSSTHEIEETDTNETCQELRTDNELDVDTIHVRILDLNGKFYNVSCRLDWSVSDMKQKVLESTEVPIALQRLIYRGRVLEDEALLDSYKVEDGHTIHLFVRAASTPDPAILNAELNANGSTSIERENGATVVNISNEMVSSSVFPSDSARRVDPLMLDSPLGNCARRVKLWSSFLLIIYTMKVMGQFALLANDQQRAAQQEQQVSGTSETDRTMNRYDGYPQYYVPDPLIGGIELMVHCFGVYVGCVGFKAAHDTDIRSIRFYCRGVVWLAFLTVVEQLYTTVQILESDFPIERARYPYGRQGPTKDDIVSANVFQTIILVAMWIIAIRHSYLHQREVSIYNQSFAMAAMNAAPPVHLPEVV